jgi:hypothetical protein
MGDKMSKSNTWEQGLLELVFNNTDFTGLGDAGGLQGSAVAGSVYISLHTADPGEAGDQTTNEGTYTGYARVAVARTAGEWSVTTGTASNVNAITYAQCTGGSNTITHFGVGNDLTGSGKLLYSGALNASLAVSTGVTPEFGTGDLTVTED